MILKASQRAGGAQLAKHLLNIAENDFVEIHEIRGFVSDNLHGAFNESYAVSRGTKCRQFLFSLSLSPPQKERVPISVFEKAIADIEEKLGLVGQPRAIVFHEKEARRHAHCVWSRIDIAKMTAINLPHFKMKLRVISRQLYLNNEWQMPRGLMNNSEHNPLNFTMAEWQQAKRTKQDPRDIKEAFQDAWSMSDTQAAFVHALSERGFYLARGDRRGFVAVDWRGEVYAVPRWVGIKAREVKAKLGDPKSLPSVEDSKKKWATKLTDKIQNHIDNIYAANEKLEATLNKKRQAMISGQRYTRKKLRQFHTDRQLQEKKDRAALLPTGLKALWFRITGKYRKIKQRIETGAFLGNKRDQLELQILIDHQYSERLQLQHKIRLSRHRNQIKIKKLNHELDQFSRSFLKQIKRNTLQKIEH